VTGKESRMTPDKGKYREIAEEVKTALTVILLNTDITLRDETLTEQGKRGAQEIKKQVWRIDRLLEALK